MRLFLLTDDGGRQEFCVPEDGRVIELLMAVAPCVGLEWREAGQLRLRFAAEEVVDSSQSISVLGMCEEACCHGTK